MLNVLICANHGVEVSPANTTAEEFENGALTLIIRIKCFPLHFEGEFKNATVTGHFGAGLEENSVI